MGLEIFENLLCDSGIDKNSGIKGQNSKIEMAASIYKT
jgi:hypothetical protein